MTYEERRDEVYEEILDLLKGNDEVTKDIHNEVDHGDHIYDMSDFDREYLNESPSVIAEEVSCGEYDSSDVYFTRSCGECNTFSDIGDCVDYDDLANYILDNEDDFNYPELALLLKKLDEEDDAKPIMVGEVPMTCEEFKEMYAESSTLLMELGESTDVDITIRPGWGWAESIEDGIKEGENYRFKEVDFCEMLKDAYTTTMPIVGYHGYIFGDNSEQYKGWFFRYFYVPEKRLLLKLIYWRIPTVEWDSEFCCPEFVVDTDSTFSEIYTTIKKY